METEKLRKYETIVVTRSDADHETQTALHEKINELMESSGARPIRFDFWGKRKLAYRIDKVSKGLYLYHLYLADNEFVIKLNRILKLSAIVLRYMTVKLEDEVDPETFDFANESHFDTLPTGLDHKKKRDRPTTGWDEAFSSDLGNEDKASPVKADEIPAEDTGEEAQPEPEEEQQAEPTPDEEKTAEDDASDGPDEGSDGSDDKAGKEE